MKKALILLLISISALAVMFFSACRGSGYNPPKQTLLPFTAEVLYDESHCNVWGLHDTGFYGYSGFAKTLMEHGIIVSRINQPLDKALASYEKNAALKVLVLNVAKHRTYSKEEISAVDAFVHAGGSLLSIGEHENTYGSADFQNAVLRLFGMEFQNDYVGDIVPAEKLERADLTVLNQKAVSAVLGLDNVHQILAAPIGMPGLYGEPVDLLRGYREGRPMTICAGIAAAKGRVAALGDSELFWNGDGSIGIESGDNRAFLVRLFEWLLDRRLVPAASKGLCSFDGAPQGTAKRIFIDTSSYGAGIDGSPGGLKALAGFLKAQGHAVCSGDECGEYDVRLVSAPLAEVRCEPGKRLILLAGSRQEVNAFCEWGRMLLRMKAKGHPSIYQKIEVCSGIRVFPCFLTDGAGKSYFDVKLGYSNHHAILHRAGALAPLPPGFKSWIDLDKKIWGETIHPGIENKNRGIPMFDITDIQEPVLSGWNDHYLIMMADDLFTNAGSKESIFMPLCRAMDTWIRTGMIK